MSLLPPWKRYTISTKRGPDLITCAVWQKPVPVCTAQRTDKDLEEGYSREPDSTGGRGQPARLPPSTWRLPSSDHRFLPAPWARSCCWRRALPCLLLWVPASLQITLLISCLCTASRSKDKFLPVASGLTNVAQTCNTGCIFSPPLPDTYRLSLCSVLEASCGSLNTPSFFILPL